ncbi:MAG: SulP family inorganic anion transporter [Candidatus Binatia bacterium]|nr:SulP family inorganic anion transporter [Candidatus Binatia bacterium]
MYLTRYLSFLDLRHYRLRFLGRDLSASISVIFLDIPQGVAYALIAGLPPAMGLYAAAFPAIIGALFRSSRHVVTGPSNALSLLVGGTVATATAAGNITPMEVGITLAFMVGVIQLLAGLLRLDALADYISHPVVRGYITGAAVLIAVGQLHNVTGTPTHGGNLLHTIAGWIGDLPHTEPLAVAFAVGTATTVLGVRRIDSRVPAPILAMTVSILLTHLLQLHTYGLRLVADLAPIPAGLPPFTLPSIDNWTALVPAAVACAVLSLVESSSVARALATRSGQRLDMAAEFAAQGLANIGAAFSGAYPVSGSLARSALNQQAGAVSRLSAVFCGLLMLVVLLFLGPLIGQTPIASLAGLLLVLASDLIDRHQIGKILRGTQSDKAAFVATMLGTWVLSLDQAIYLGVGISLVLFLRQARLLTAREMAIGRKGRFREIDPDVTDATRVCRAIRILNLTGPLFFAVAGELERALDRFTGDAEMRVLILRLRQAQNLDVTTVNVLEAAAEKLAREGRTLLLLGLRPPALRLLQRTGSAARIGKENVFPAQPGWFTAMEAALQRALALVGPHSCGTTCPLAEYMAAQSHLRTPAATTPQDVG